MPTLFVVFGLRFFFYADEHPPIHIHVESSDGRAKFLVDPEISLVYNRGINPRALRRAREIVTRQQKEIIEKWHEFHG